MAQQGFNFRADNPYVYQEPPDGSSSAIGIDTADGDKLKIKIQSTPGAFPTGTTQVIIDPAANGDISLAPNGSGSVNVSTAVNLPHADNGSAQGYVTFNDIKFMHNYGDGNTFVGQLSGNSTLTPASSLGNTAIGKLAGTALTTGALNTLIGNSAGPNVTTGNNNTAIGQSALGSATSSNSTALGFNALAAYAPGSSDTGQVAVGFDCLQSVVTGTECTAMGAEAGQNLTAASQCTIIGRQACDVSTTIGNANICIGYRAARSSTLGANNIILGNSSGTGYTTSEANNILVNHAGTAADANTIRVGTQGAGANQQNKCFVAGITGVNVGSVANVVSIATGTGQLGTTAITAGSGITVTPGANTITISSTGADLLAYTNVNTTPYVVLSTDEFLSVDCSGGVITVQLPNAPSTGRVFAIKDRTGSANSNAITVTTVGGVVNIDGATSYTMNTQYASIQVIFNGTSYEIW